jgi:hypothetical protein
MPSPAERSRLELGLRLLSLAVMAWLIAGTFVTRKPTGGQVVQEAGLERTLEAWSIHPRSDTLGIEFHTAPSRLVRDWARALRRSGSAVVWADSGVAPAMLEIEPLEDPSGGATVRITAPRKTPIVVSDSLGPLDSLQLDALGATIRVPAFSGRINARVGGTPVHAALAVERPARSIVVLGMAGWESKFVARALEERGWQVDARFSLAPRLSVDLGRSFPLDTARHALVIALDSSAATYAPEISRFVRSGGGLILGNGGLGVRLGELAPGRAGALTRPAALTFESEPQRALALRDLAPLKSDAFALDSRDGRVGVAARRVGSGRVLQIGYRDTWRWRMEGGASSVAAHRAWWAGLVATVAYRPTRFEEPSSNPAPLAALTLALGSPSQLPTERPVESSHLVPLAILVLSLFGEWTSRRLRGEA